MPPVTRVFRLLALTLLALAAAPSSRANGLSANVERVWIRADSLMVDFSVRGLFSEQITKELTRGLPMTYAYSIQLWHDRSGWWDALKSEVTKEFKLQRNVWDDRYFVVSQEGSQRWLKDLDALERHLSRRLGQFVSTVSGLPRGKTYYVSLTASLRPLTIEDIQEVEAWLTGEIEEGGGLSTVTRLPIMVFGVFVDLAGLGDKSTLARSGRFRLDPPERSEAPREDD